MNDVAAEGTFVWVSGQAGDLHQTGTPANPMMPVAKTMPRRMTAAAGTTSARPRRVRALSNRPIRFRPVCSNSRDLVRRNDYRAAHRRQYRRGWLDHVDRLRPTTASPPLSLPVVSEHVGWRGRHPALPWAAISSQLVLNPAAAAIRGTYSVVVSNATPCSATSNTADVRVLAIQTQPVSQTGECGQFGDVQRHGPPRQRVTPRTRISGIRAERPSSRGQTNSIYNH